MEFKHRLISGARSSEPRIAAPAHAVSANWSAWMRQIERKRRQLFRLSPAGQVAHAEFASVFSTRLTAASFRLDGMEVADAAAEMALSAPLPRRAVRSRLSQRLRNHLAIIWGIQRLLALGRSLKVSAVIRWYTSISCGLCNAALDEATMNRLSSVIGRINSPRLRLQPAVQDVARLHSQLMADPLVPSFNGILARLLLCYHLGRCSLPPIVFDSATDGPVLAEESTLLPRLMELIDSSYSLLLSGHRPDPVRV